MKTRYVRVSEGVKQTDGKLKQEFKDIAVFHQFGVDYEEFETGPGNYSTAIVEFKDGSVGNIPLYLIEFLGDNAVIQSEKTITLTSYEFALMVDVWKAADHNFKNVSLLEDCETFNNIAAKLGII